MTPQEIARTFHDSIAPELFAGAVPVTRPVLILLGGQPGAGKSRAAAHLFARHQDQDIVAVIGDDFRRHHSDYARVQREDPTQMPQITAAAAGEWTRMAVETGLAGRYPLLIEGTWRSQNIPLTTATAAAGAGYDVHAAVVAVPAALSLIGTLARYYDEPPGHARWTPVTAHDDTMSALPASVRALAESPHIARFTILDRAGDVHLDEPARDLPGRATRAGRIYDALTRRALTTHELAGIIRDVDRILPRHEAHTLTAPAATQSWDRLADELGTLTAAAPPLTQPLQRIQNPRASQAARTAAIAFRSLRDELTTRTQRIRAANPPQPPPRDNPEPRRGIGR